MENPFGPGGYWSRKFVDKEVFPSPETMTELDRVLEELDEEIERTENHGGLSPGQVVRNMGERITSVTNKIPRIAEEVGEAIRQGKTGDVLNILKEAKNLYPERNS